jgi:hypothetical protein
MPCWDCGERFERRRLVTREVMDHNDEGMGYEMIRAKVCRACDLKRNGVECDTCGELHLDFEAAMQCCTGPEYGDAPDCPECGRRMKATAKGYDPIDGPSITCAECECCPVFWGAFTGFDYTDDGPCKHTDNPTRTTEEA